MMLTDLATVLRKSGLDVVELPGWKTKGHGPMRAIKGLTLHHTASGRGTGTTLGLSTVRDGRPGLAGPLAQLYLNRAGTFYVVAAGLAYHAGVSRQADQTNSYRIGIEALAAGDGWSQDWPEDQLNAMLRGSKALADHYRFPVAEILGHKETCSPVGRKIDPSFSMANFRTRVQHLSSAPVKSPAEKDNSMELSTKVNYTNSAAERLQREEDTVGFVMQWPPAVRFARDEIEQVRSDVHELTVKVDALKPATKVQVDNLTAVVSGLQTTVGTKVADLSTKLDEILALLRSGQE